MTKKRDSKRTFRDKLKAFSDNPAVACGLEQMVDRGAHDICALISAFSTDSCFVVAYADELGVRFTSDDGGSGTSDHGWVPWEVLESLLVLKQAAQALNKPDDKAQE